MVMKKRKTQNENENEERHPGGGIWCPEHKCYHAGQLDVTQRTVLSVIRDRFKLTTRQAKDVGLGIDGDIVFVPERSPSEPNGWVLMRYRWSMDGQQLHLAPPDDEPSQSRN
jgi:hypothetical protein